VILASDEEQNSNVMENLDSDKINNPVGLEEHRSAINGCSYFLIFIY